MKNILFIIPFLVLVSCSRKVIETTKWQKSGITADGNPTEWELPLKYFDTKSKINYEFSNDLKNLYMAIRVTDKDAMVRVLSSGVTLELNTDGDSDYPYLVKFPARDHKMKQGQHRGRPGEMPKETSGENTNENSNEEFNPEEISPEQGNPGEMNKNEHDNRMEENQQFILKGFNNNTEETVVHVSEANGITANLNMIDSINTLFYEMVIPFETFHKLELTPDDTTTLVALKMTIEESGFSPKGNPPGGDNNEQNRPQGPPPGGGGGMPQGGGGNGGGMNPGGMPQGGDQQGQQGSSTSEIKMKLHLSYQE